MHASVHGQRARERGEISLRRDEKLGTRFASGEHSPQGRGSADEHPMRHVAGERANLAQDPEGLLLLLLQLLLLVLVLVLVVDL